MRIFADNLPYEQIGNTNPVCINNEIPFSIPKSWSWIRLGELCYITNGFTPSRTKREIWENGDISWFTYDDILTQDRRISYTKQKLTSTASEKISNKILHP